MDSEVKQQAQELFSNLGMDMTTAINVFLRQAILHKGFHFDLRLEVPNATTVRAIKEVERMKRDPHKALYDDFSQIVKMVIERGEYDAAPETGFHLCPSPTVLPKAQASVLRIRGRLF
jgi:DNA-damage-inducible protein J